MLWFSSICGCSEVGRSPGDYVPLGGPGGISGRVSPRLRVCGGKGSGELPLRGAVESLATAFPLLGGKGALCPGGDKPAEG